MRMEGLQYHPLALEVLAFVSILFLKQASAMEAPFVTFFLVSSAWTTAIALLARRETIRSGALLCSSVFFCLAVIETSTYFVARSQIIITKTTPATWRRDAMDICSLPLPNTATQFKEFLDGRLMADVTYTIDASSLREIPAALQGRPHKVAFFGCSFMFGHGVEN